MANKKKNPNLRFKCRVCGKLTAGRSPRSTRETVYHGFYYPRRHKVDGVVCKGSFDEAIWVENGIESY